MPAARSLVGGISEYLYTYLFVLPIVFHLTHNYLTLCYPVLHSFLSFHFTPSAQSWGRTEEKILKIGGSKLFHPSAVADLMEGPDGEKIGPFLNARHIMQLSSSYRNDGIDAQKDAFAKLCDEVYGKEGEERHDEYEKSATQFVQYFDEAVEALEVFYAKQDDGKEDNRKAIIARKKEILTQIIPILEEAVEELPDNVKALAMDHYWCEDDTQLPLRFSLPQVHQKLVTFIRAPSYASQKRVDDAVASIRENLNTFASHPEFTSFSFLTAHTACDPLHRTRCPDNAPVSRSATTRIGLPNTVRFPNRSRSRASFFFSI